MSELIKIDLSKGLDEYGNAFDLPDILKAHEDELKSGTISKQTISEMIGYFLDIKESKSTIICFHIDQIYRNMMYMKFYDDSIFDSCNIRRMIEAIHYLSNDLYFKMDYNAFMNGNKTKFYDIHGMCQKVYTELKIGSFLPDDDRMKDTIDEDEDFSVEHLLDIKYHLKRLKSIRKENDKEFHTLMDNNLWRYL